MVRVVDRAGVDARVLEERGHERLARTEVVRQLRGAEVATAVGGDDIAGVRTFRQAVVDRIADAVIRTEKPETVAHDEAADIQSVVLAREAGLRAAGGDDRLRVRLQ